MNIITEKEQISVFPLRWFRGYTRFFMLLVLVPFVVRIWNQLWSIDFSALYSVGLFLYVTALILLYLFLIILGFSANYGLHNFTKRGFRQNRAWLFCVGIVTPTLATFYENQLLAFGILLCLSLLWVVPNLIYFEKRRYLFYADDPIPFEFSPASPLRWDVQKRVITYSIAAIISSAILGFCGLLLSSYYYQVLLNAYQNQVQSLSQNFYDMGYEDGIEKGKTNGNAIGYTNGYQKGKDEGYEKGYSEGREVGIYTIPDLHLTNAYIDYYDNEQVIRFYLQNTTSKTCFGWKMEIELFSGQTSEGTYVWTWDRTISPGSTFNGQLYTDDGKMNSCTRFVVHSITWTD